MATINVQSNGAYGGNLADIQAVASAVGTVQLGTSWTVTGYTAHASGATPVTSNAATDLDTTAAALAALEDEVTALKVVLDAAGITT